MSTSDRLIAFLVACAIVAGYIAGLAWPRPEARVTEPIAVFCVALVALLTVLVMHMRRGRP